MTIREWQGKKEGRERMTKELVKGEEKRYHCIGPLFIQWHEKELGRVCIHNRPVLCVHMHETIHMYHFILVVTCMYAQGLHLTRNMYICIESLTSAGCFICYVDTSLLLVANHA